MIKKQTSASSRSKFAIIFISFLFSKDEISSNKVIVQIDRQGEDGTLVEFIFVHPIKMGFEKGTFSVFVE
jgi:hypothetical protein